MWNTVLFDLDGTLTDSGPGITRCVQYALEKFGIHVDNVHDLDVFVGPPLKESFMKYAHLTDADSDRAIGYYRERYSTKGIYENTLYSGIGALLASLSAEGMTLAVASSKPEQYCSQILRYFGIAHYFHAVVGSEMDGTRVQKSEVVEEALQRLGMTNRRSEVVLVGDRSYDIAGAKAAGIGSIGTGWGYGSRAELEAEWPDCITDTVQELKNVLIGQYRDGLRGGDAADTGTYQQGAYEQYGGYSGQNSYQQNGEFRQQGSYQQPPYRERGRNSDGSVFYRIWRVLYPFLLDLLISNVVASAVLVVILMATGGVMGGGYGAFTNAYDIYMSQILLITGIADGVMIPVFWLFKKNDEAKRTAYRQNDRLLVKKKLTGGAVVCILVLTYAVSDLLNWLVVVLRLPSNDTLDLLNDSISTTAPWLMVIVVCVVGPIAEELLFRGLIYRRARDYAGMWGGAVISGLFFGIAHGNWQQGVFAFVFGIILSLIYEHYGTLWASILAHFFNNLAATVIDSVTSSMPSGVHVALLIVSAALAVLTARLIFVRDEKVNRI